MFRQVPVLPVVVPLAVLVVAVALVPLARRGRLTAPRAAVALTLGVYAAGIVANTVFPIFLDKPARHGGWTSHLALAPLAGYQLDDALINVAVFVPLGMLVPLLTARPSWRRTVLVAASISLGIEATQYVTAHALGGGHIADLNDLVLNVLGGVVGYGVLAALVRVPGAAALVDRFRWADGPRPLAAPAPV
ncbi:VanZ family protein [Cellulomonas sp. SLBN-39]|uniref:VanZ family protein n=1 Tax=Cellulomonas sp. SLBN-39 TaxID=2768446 RepID=UPI0011548298|nr:VanZ family protein [Cellulomonas sp. SLBN-39]TQL01964.1 glycopeptide antibiotics resistance protein [Cellulomonas sp. SLBN-39]